MSIKVYLTPDIEFPDMQRLVIEQVLAGKTKETEGQRCKDKTSAIRRGLPRLLVILNKAWLAGKKISIVIDE